MDRGTECRQLKDAKRSLSVPRITRKQQLGPCRWRFRLPVRFFLHNQKGFEQIQKFALGVGRCQAEIDKFGLRGETKLLICNLAFLRLRIVATKTGMWETAYAAA